MHPAADLFSSTQTLPGTTVSTPRGCFITLEGIDGAGKSTHADWIVQFLQTRRLPVVHTREPGGTVLGERLRALLLEQPMHPDTELLLMFAARNQHLAELVIPHLQRGSWVVCDRFTDATYAYQGGGRGLAEPRIAELEAWVQKGLQPDCTFLFDIDTDTARARLHQLGQPDRFESEPTEFFERTRQAYLHRASQHADRFYIIDSTKSVAAIQAELAVHLEGLVRQHAGHAHD